MIPLLHPISFQAAQSLAHPLTRAIVLVVAALLVTAPFILMALRRTERITSDHFREMWLRWKSWLWLSLAIIIPILLGPAFVSMAAALLGLFCYREFSRATGLFRERSVNLTIILGIVILAASQILGGERWFLATAAATAIAILLVSIPSDQPNGFIQRVSLGLLAFILFGYCIGYLGLLARAPEYQPLLLLLVLAIELNDIAAYCSGKAFGRKKLLPRTSHGKTIAGFLGALIFTTALVAIGGAPLFPNQPLRILLLTGVAVSLLGQFGDLLVSSIKRDLGAKDLGVSIPGHGGLLDRFDSLLLVPPVIYHLLVFLSANSQPATLAGL